MKNASPSLVSSMIKRNRGAILNGSKPVNDMEAPANSATVRMMQEFIREQQEEQRLDPAFDMRSGARDHLEPWQRRTRFGTA